jgi:hypothetical protein
VKDEEKYEEIIANTEGDPLWKQEFRGLRSKIVDKLEDEIIGEIVSLVKQLGQGAVIFLVNMAMYHTTGQGAPINP